MKVAPRYTLFTLFKLLYTALNVACMPIYILLEKVKTLLEWADELLSKMLDGLEWILVSENGLFLTLGSGIPVPKRESKTTSEYKHTHN